MNLLQNSIQDAQASLRKSLSAAAASKKALK